MPLGSDSTLGLAGPNGMPDIAELPAPAEPAGGTSSRMLSRERTGQALQRG